MSPLAPDFNALLAEQAEIDLITGKSYVFSVPRPDNQLTLFLKKRDWRWPLRWWVDTYLVQYPTLGKLCHVSRELLLLDFDLRQVEGMDTVERVAAVERNAAQLARVVAVMVLLNSQAALNEQVNKLAERFIESIDQYKLLELVRLINVMCDMGPFILSIGLLKAQHRMTAPTPIEQANPATTVSTAG